MGTIAAGTAAIQGAPPGAPSTPPAYGTLSAGAVERLRAAGISDDVITIADGVVGSTPGAAAGAGGLAAPSLGGAPGGLALPAPAPGATAALPQPASAAPIDQPDATHPTLASSHVMVLRATGTPEYVLQDLARQAPATAAMEEYIQQQIMRYPEGWDAFTGNPAGTARAGLVQLGLPVAPPTGGMPQMPVTDSAFAPGMAAPGLPAQPMPPARSGVDEALKAVIIGGVGIGIGVLGYRFYKGHISAATAKQAVQGVETLGMSGGQLGQAAAGVSGAAGFGLGAQPSAVGWAGQHAASLGLPVREDVAQLLNAGLVYGVDGRSVMDYAVRIKAAETLQGASSVLGTGGGGMVADGAAAAARTLL